MKSDRELQLDVLEELRWEPGVNATDIGATVKDGRFAGLMPISESS